LTRCRPATRRLALAAVAATTQGPPGRPGSRQSAVGLITGDPIGQGATFLSDRVTKTTSGTIDFGGKFTIYTTTGSLTATIKVVIAPTSAGGATGAGSGTLTNGTGRYKGAHGHFTLHGSQSPTAPDFVVQITGNVSY
jgi:hypothetical protein